MMVACTAVVVYSDVHNLQLRKRRMVILSIALVWLLQMSDYQQQETWKKAGLDFSWRLAFNNICMSKNYEVIAPPMIQPIMSRIFGMTRSW